jgi:hypothetical protein
VRDAERTPVAQTSAVLSFPALQANDLLVGDWTTLGSQRVRLTFNQPLRAASARSRGNYRITPSPGRVSTVAFSEDEHAGSCFRSRGAELARTG